MQGQSGPRPAAAWRRFTLIASGMVMYLFILCHLLNLALGLWGMPVMDDLSPMLTGLWSGPLGYVLLLSMIVHFALALWQLHDRNTLRIPTYDRLQLLAGIAIVPLLAPHVTGIVAAQAMGIEVSYAYLMPYFWLDAPGQGFRQVMLLTVAWLHGSIGIITWLSARARTRRVLPVFYPFAVLVPIVALLGYVEAGRQAVAIRLGLPGAPPAPPAPNVTATPEEVQSILAAMTTWNSWLVWGSLGLVGLVLVARWLRIRAMPRDQIVRVEFADRLGDAFSAGTGLTLLELAQEADIPHAGLCRGRGRCGTCRVEILRSDGPLPPPEAQEAKTLARVGCGPGVRLACQIRPAPGLLEVERLVSPDYSNLDALTTTDADGDVTSPDTPAEPAT